MTTAKQASKEQRPMNQPDADDVLKAIELIPDEEKGSLLKAMDRCPDVFEGGECDLRRFLRYTEGDPWRAAQCVNQYWSYREKLFGAERAFLPLTQTSEAALTTEDVLAVKTGNYVVLRRTPAGEPVLFVDRSRVLAESSTETKLRAFFYMAHYFLAQVDQSPTLNCHILVLLITPRTIPMDVNFVRGAVQLLNILPARNTIHLIMCMPKQGSTPLIQSIMAAGLSFASTNINGLKVHTNPVGAPILADLKGALGLQPEDLPPSIGGTWTYENHRKWCRTKLIEEEERTGLPDASGPGNKKRPPVNEETKRKKIKSLNVIHSRQKRERRKTEGAALQKEFEDATRQNQLLKAENARLHGLLETAREIVIAMDAQAPLSTQAFPPPILSDGPSLVGPRAQPQYNPMGQDPLRTGLVPGAFPPNAPSQPADLQLALGTLLNQSPEVQQALADLLEQNLQRQVGAPMPTLVPVPLPSSGWTSTGGNGISSSSANSFGGNTVGDQMQGSLPHQSNPDSRNLGLGLLGHWNLFGRNSAPGGG